MDSVEKGLRDLLRVSMERETALQSKLDTLQREHELLKRNAEYLADGHKRADELQSRLDQVRLALAQNEHVNGPVLDRIRRIVGEKWIAESNPGCGVEKHEHVWIAFGADGKTDWCRCGATRPRDDLCGELVALGVACDRQKGHDGLHSAGERGPALTTWGRAIVDKLDAVIVERDAAMTQLRECAKLLRYLTVIADTRHINHSSLQSCIDRANDWMNAHPLAESARAST